MTCVMGVFPQLRHGRSGHPRNLNLSSTTMRLYLPLLSREHGLRLTGPQVARLTLILHSRSCLLERSIVRARNLDFRQIRLPPSVAGRTRLALPFLRYGLMTSKQAQMDKMTIWKPLKDTQFLKFHSRRLNNLQYTGYIIRCRGIGMHPRQ